MIGFVGAGNMATALMRGMMQGGVPASEIKAFDVNAERVEAMRALGIEVVSSIESLASVCETVVVAVKPKDCGAVLSQLNACELVRELVCIALGWSQAMLAEALPSARGIAHAMPNTPALVGEGVTAFNQNHTIDPLRFAEIEKLFSACGRTVVVPEALFDAVTGISGSGPAYAYIFIEALADAGVLQGLPRDMAYTLASQMLLGAAKMVLETGEHPGKLKDAVCSPSGATIEAVYALEKAGLRGAVIDAVNACAKKAAQAGKKS